MATGFSQPRKTPVGAILKKVLPEHVFIALLISRCSTCRITSALGGSWFFKLLFIILKEANKEIYILFGFF